MIISKRASIFIYILMLVSISLVLWLVVFNNSISLTNNLNIWKNSEEVFNILSKKAQIAIDTVKKYNKNGDWYTDDISCPTNVTMSGSNNISTWISTNMVLDNWSIYCRGYYNWGSGDKEFRIYYNSDYSDFIKAYYDRWSWNDIVDLDPPITTSTWNLAETNLASIVANWSNTDYLTDDLPTVYISNKSLNSSVLFELDNYYNIWKIAFIKPKSNWQLWHKWKLSWWSTSECIDWFKTFSDIKPAFDPWESNFATYKKNVKFVKIESTNWKKKINLTDFYIYKAIVHSWWIDTIVDNPWDFIWKWHRVFNDSDNTLISFDGTWIWWGDDIDDNFNSDDYKVLSNEVTGTYYFPWFEDDDVVPRKTIFWNVSSGEELYNIFWNNYKTNDFIEWNSNNDDIINVKIWDIGSWSISNWTLYLDLYSIWEYNYDLKILEFGRDDYKNKYTLIPLKTSLGEGLTDYVWYIQKSSTWSLSLSREKTWNEYEFDFSSVDYWIYITNHGSENLSYRLSWEVITADKNDTWSWIYINPIDDSWDNISVMANHMIIGWEKNFIWENFVVTDAK